MDEAQITRNGIQNFHNQLRSADENLHAIPPSHLRQRFSINIWTIISGNNL
jgi:hypothetical protein